MNRDPRQPAVPGPVGPAEMPTAPVDGLTERPQATVRLFGTTDFFRLWIAQVVSALGDWIGFFAIVAIASRIGGGSPEAAISLVMTARILPGFFIAPLVGVVVDRWDRKRIMVVCDVGRGLVFASLPFADALWQLVLASLLLEVFTLLWQPAKEASVPNLVPVDHLTTANSLSLVAAYGTVPFAAAIFAGLVKVAEWLSGVTAIQVLQRGETVAVWFNVLTFLVAAVLISTLALPRRTRRADRRPGMDFGQTLKELREGWSFVFVNPVARSVIIGLATGLIGGGMLVPLGPVFSTVVLGAGNAGFGVLVAALGVGVALGVVGLSIFQTRIDKDAGFCVAALVSGVALILAASTSTLTPAAALIVVLGVCAGAVYVLGFTILHESVDDELRGRIFSALYTMVRLCVLLAFALGPLLAGGLDTFSRGLVGGQVSIGDVEIALPGVRLALWLAGLIIIGAGTQAVVTLRRPRARAGDPGPDGDGTGA